MDESELTAIIARALDEDIGDGDVTTENTIPETLWLRGRFVAKAEGVAAGIEVARRVFAQLDERVRLYDALDDGAEVRPGQTIAHIEGPGRALLMGERVALNFMQRMSGVATLTRRFVNAVAGTRAVILDTRKTAPGLRLIDKWAVRLGGGQNHRFGLYDMVLIKDNHIAAVGSIREAVQRVRAGDQRGRPIEVEVQTLDELREALELSVDRILLDNMSLETMREAVRLARGRVALEASGNVSLQTVRAIVETGVDYISVGLLTHSPPALDISLTINSQQPTVNSQQSVHSQP